MDYKINDTIIQFHTKKIKSKTSKIYESNDRKYIIKQITKRKEYDVYKREKYILSLLHKNNIDWCPKLITYNDKQQILVMNHCGVPITRKNKPVDVVNQFKKIINDMLLLNITHNDIKSFELLVKNNKLYLCDYGWASINNNHSCGINIWHGVKPRGYLNDNTALYRININNYNEYVDNNRSSVSNGSQSEVPKLEIKNNQVIVSGYQKYIMDNDNIIFKSKIPKYNLIQQTLFNLKNTCNSITDIGCSNGIVSFIAHKLDYNVLSLDHDVECINLIQNIINHQQLSINNITCETFSFGDIIKTNNDIVIMLALIHWIYSCTAINGNFDKIFQYLKPYINKYLLIEWVDNLDSAIRKFNHINYNINTHQEKYNVANFEKSLIKNIGTIINRIELDGKTRILYIVKV
jgi:hypothetical protein